MPNHEGTPAQPAVVEPNVVPEIFLTGLLPAEDMGDFVRITGYSELVPPGMTRAVRVVVMRCIWPKAAYLAAREIVDSTIRKSSRVLALVK